MGAHVDYVKKKFGPLKDKTLQTALAHRIQTEFPRLGGPRVVALCAEMLLEELGRHLDPKEHVAHGQVRWLGIAVDSPPRRHQRIRDTELVPVTLDLSLPEDVEDRIARRTPKQRLCRKAVRLCHQAYTQGALLSNCDLAELLATEENTVAHVLAAHERETQKLVPRRATVHDVGTGLTHKRIICWKRYAEGKPADQVARETYHTLQSVDRYLGDYDRVRHCRLQGLNPEETAFAIGRTVSLVREYLAIDAELEGRHA